MKRTFIPINSSEQTSTPHHGQLQDAQMSIE
jgi:hypothetical protein